ncbi:MAG TPA: DUF5715 family protein [Trebonia sp.]|nr:DUF5715 family protein [Trebonia sp.]
MGEHGKAMHQMDASGSAAQPSPVLPDSLLLGYRAAADDLVREASGHTEASGLAAVEALVSRRLLEPEFSGVLSYLSGGADVAAAGIIREIRDYHPSARDSASDLATYIRILLLSQIDSVWWSRSIPFTADADVLESAELVDLAALKSARLLEFQYHAQPAGLFGRAMDWTRHKVFPDLRPRVSGLRFTYSRPVVVAVVNQLALDFAAALPPRTPRIWVTSMVRSVEHQHRLRSLGYAAVLPSAHCAGYACDLESNWFRRFDPDNRLARLLLERQEAGQLNVIDEGRTWHLCVNPNACDELQALYDSQLRAR